MAQWVSFTYKDKKNFGVKNTDTVEVYSGDMFNQPVATGEKISVKNAQLFPTQHPRCGTSFMFIVLLSAIIVFSIIDSFIMMFTGNITLVSRLLFHLPMIPIVAGISYELIKISSRNDNLFFRILRTPGLWLQNITTRQPDDEMVEVAIHAIEKAFGKKLDSMSGKQYVAEAVG